MSSPQPPKLFTRFFKWYCKPELQESIMGDLEEQFEEDFQTYGLQKARKNYRWTIIRFFRKGIIGLKNNGRKLNYYGMLKNYFTTSLRFIRREKVYAFMNISGLAMGITCGLIIYKILDHSFSYDKHHANYQYIYRVNNEDLTTNGVKRWRGQVHPLANALRTDFPAIHATMTYYQKEAMIGIEGQNGQVTRYQEKAGIAFVESDFLQLFTVPFLAGDPKTALDGPGKVLLTARMAKKYFGLSSDNAHKALGRTVILENKKTSYVTGIIKDIPTSTDFPFDVLFHYQDQEASNPWFNEGKSWGEYNSATNCYILLPQGIDPIEFEKQLVPIVAKYLPEHVAEKRTYRLQALSNLHYSSEIRKTYAGITTTKEELTVLGLVGLFLIITACVNFVNLSTAQAVKRSKEVGVRKTMGSGRVQLIFQFLCETLIITLIASAVAFLLAFTVTDTVEHIFRGQIQIDLLSDVHVIYFLLAVIFGVTLLAGLYPAMILARMNPILAIKNKLNVKQTSGFLSLRRALVILQFTISQILIIGILVLNAQMNYFKTKDLGFNEESIVIANLPDKDNAKLETIRNQLLAHSSIDQVSFSSSSPMDSWRSSNPIFHPNIEGDDHIGNLKTTDASYFEVYEMEFIAGEPFKKNDPMTHTVVNRKVAASLGFENPTDLLGEQIEYGEGSLKFTVVGVVEDFHSGSLHADMENVLMANVPWNVFQANIKLLSNQSSMDGLKESIAHIEKHWQEAFPENVIDLRFYDQEIADMYQLEQSVSQVFQLFVVIAMLIGALGLYGLVSFMANQRTKEIGIRKVMGATKMNIWNIFSKELVTLLAIAFAIASPIGYFLMRAFLNTYAYRIEFGPKFFLAAISMSILIALITVGHKSMRVARANPIHSLRDE